MITGEMTAISFDTKKWSDTLYSGFAVNINKHCHEPAPKSFFCHQDIKSQSFTKIILLIFNTLCNLVSW